MAQRGDPRGTGKGLGRGVGQRRGIGPDGECFCPKCGEHFSHQRGVPCFINKCPKCGSLLVRK
jgi:hypothetical protein